METDYFPALRSRICATASLLASGTAITHYYKHFGLYVYRKRVLLEFAGWEESTLERMEKLEQLRFLEHGIRIRTTMTEHESIPIDTAEDAERVRAILRGRESGEARRK